MTFTAGGQLHAWTPKEPLSGALQKVQSPSAEDRQDCYGYGQFCLEDGNSQKDPADIKYNFKICRNNGMHQHPFKRILAKSLFFFLINFV